MNAPLPAVARPPADFPTWLPAMLVKELRQGLRTRGFVGTLVGFQIMMTLFTVFALAGGAGSGSYALLQGAFWTVLTLQLLVITPARALAGLQAELESRAVDLLMLTRLTAWRVVLGKWISLLAQAALLVVALLPYGVARYFFGSVDLAGEVRQIGLIFAGGAVLTAAALWASVLPRLARVGLGLLAVFAWQIVPGGLTALLGLSSRSARPVSGPAWMGAANGALFAFDAAILLVLCLIGAVRRLAPAAENQAPLLRALPLLAALPAPLLGLRAAVGQLVLAACLAALIAAVELARGEEPMANHWRDWSRRGRWGRWVGRLVQPGWASALEWMLAIGAALMVGAAGSGEGPRIARIVLLAETALVFPALLLTWLGPRFAQRAAGYVLLLGAASLISVVGSASAALLTSAADLLLQLLPISSFWSAVYSRPPAAGVQTAQIAIAVAVLGLTWWRGRLYRRRWRDYDAVPSAPAVS
jgi:ABC-type transport system involved in multi-copper enzyme maturation permease subunit